MSRKLSSCRRGGKLPAMGQKRRVVEAWHQVTALRLLLLLPFDLHVPKASRVDALVNTLVDAPLADFLFNHDQVQLLLGGELLLSSGGEGGGQKGKQPGEQK